MKGLGNKSNAAGLHEATVNSAPIEVRQEAINRFNVEKNGNGVIMAYFVDYDLLTLMQNQFHNHTVLPIPKAIGTPIELDGDLDYVAGPAAAAAVTALTIARNLPILPNLLMALGVTSLASYPLYYCHTLDRLLYGFLVKEKPLPQIGIDENLLKEPLTFRNPSTNRVF